jgi:hypothetical protein
MRQMGGGGQEERVGTQGEMLGTGKEDGGREAGLGGNDVWFGVREED